MDYKGNYFNDDEDESTVMPPSKAGKIIKKILKILIYSISALIFIVLFWSIFRSRDIALYSTKYFSDATNSLEQKTYYEIIPTGDNSSMSYKGRVQLGNIYYVPESGEMEIGVKMNLADTEYKDPARLVFVLKDTHGTEYEITAFNEGSTSKYCFARVCFGNLNIDIEQNYYYKKVEAFYRGAELDYSVDEQNAGLIYKLYIYEKDDDGNLVLLDDLIDKDYQRGESDIDDSGLKVYDNKTIVQTED